MKTRPHLGILCGKGKLWSVLPWASPLAQPFSATPWRSAHRPELTTSVSRCRCFRSLLIAALHLWGKEQHPAPMREPKGPSSLTPGRHVLPSWNRNASSIGLPLTCPPDRDEHPKACVWKKQPDYLRGPTTTSSLPFSLESAPASSSV